MFDDKKNIFINIIDDFLEFNFNDLMNKYNWGNNEYFW
jgi:hypothetical protein